MSRKGRKAKKASGKKDASVEEAEAARKVMDRAIKRLNVLEYLILVLAVILALLGGAVVAWILNRTLEYSFRLGWAASSLLLFIVPGGLVYLRERRSQAGLTKLNPNNDLKDLHG